MADDGTRTRILNAAGEAFAERGFRATTIREICRRADVNLASVNYHFGDKKRLYIETIKAAHEFHTQRVPLPDWPPGTPPQARLRGFIRTMARRVLTPQQTNWQPRLMMREVLDPTAACEGLVEDYIGPLFQQLLSIIGELVPPDMPEYQRRQLAFSIVGQCLFYRFHRGVIDMLAPQSERNEHYSPEQLADHIADVMLAALGHQSFIPAETSGPLGVDSDALTECTDHG